MIGKKISGMVLDGFTLEFYKWEDGNVKSLLGNVRASINDLAKVSFDLSENIIQIEYFDHVNS